MLHGAAATVGAGDEEKCVAHQAFGNVFRAFEEPANLQVDACAQLLYIGFRWQCAFGQGGEKTGGDPPERACRGDILRCFNALHGIEHFTDAAAILWCTQPGQQSALEAGPLLTQQALEVVTV